MHMTAQDKDLVAVVPAGPASVSQVGGCELPGSGFNKRLSLSLNPSMRATEAATGQIYT